MPTILDWQDAIRVLEQQRGVLPDDVLETALGALRRKIRSHNDVDPADDTTATAPTAILHASVVTGWLSNESSSTGRALTALFELQMRLKTIATEYGGTIMAHAGYDVIALFAVKHGTVSVMQAVQAATQIRSEVQQMHVKRLTPPYVQIGIHFTSRQLAADTPRDDDSLRLTRELKDLAAPNEILLSYAAYRESRERYSVHFAKASNFDGRTVRMYRLVGSRRETTPHQDAVHGVTTRLVGRQAEQQLLQNTVRAAINQGHLHAVALAGQAGSGKSRLVREFYGWLEVIPEPVLFFEAHAVNHTRQQPFGLLRAMLARRVNITASDTHRTAHDRLVNTVVEIVGEDNRARAESLSELLGLNILNNQFSPRFVNLRELRETAFSIIIEYMHGLLRRFGDPMVIVLEDFQNIDENSLQFLQLLVQRLADYPIVLVITLDTNCDTPTLQSPVLRHVVQCHQIKPLSRHATELLIAELLRNVPGLTSEDADTIAALTDGNPGNIWEHIRWLISIGALVTDVREWRIDRNKLPTRAATPSLRERATARLATLPEDERTVLVAAAVIGEVFWDTALEALLRDMDDIALLSCLHELSRLNLIRPRPATAVPGTVEYLFEDKRYCELVYTNADADMRQKLHAAYATWLIGSGVNRTGQYSSTIAYHFQQANDTARAAKWYILAGRQSMQCYAPEIARHQFEAAQTILQGHDDLHDYRLETLDGLGAVYYILADYDAARQVNETVLALSRAPEVRAAAFAHLGQIAERVGDIAACLKMTRHVETTLADLEQPPALIQTWVHLNYCTSYRQLGDYTTAQEHAEQAVALYRDFDDDMLATAYAALGEVYMARNQLDMASVYFNKSQVLARQFASRRLEAYLQDNIGTLARRRGDFQTAQLLHQQALDTASLINSQQTMHSATVHLGRITVDRHQYRRAVDIISNILPTLRTGTNRTLLCEALTTFATAHLGLEAYDVALHEALRAFAVAQELQGPMQHGVVWRLLGRVGADSGTTITLDTRTYTPEECFTSSITHFKRLQNEIEVGLTLWVWSQYDYKLERLTLARQRWQSALRSVEDAHAPLLARYMRRYSPAALRKGAG